jgi:hypothetical protein
MRPEIDNLHARLFNAGDERRSEKAESVSAGAGGTAGDGLARAAADFRGGSTAGERTAARESGPAGQRLSRVIAAREWQRALEWARREGRLIERLPDWLTQLENEGESEHDAWFDPESGRYVKLAYEKPDEALRFGNWPVVDAFGYALGDGTVGDYLERVANALVVFGSDDFVHGVVTEAGHRGILISQTEQVGRRPGDDEIRGALQGKGFTWVTRLDFLRPDGMAVLDLHAGNAVIREDGMLRPFDPLAVQAWPELRRAMERKLAERLAHGGTHF